MSAAMTVAPRRAARTTAPSPTIPQPMTITVSVSVTAPRDTAWKPTLIGSTSAASRVPRFSAGITFSQGTAISPRIAPSLWTPSVWLSRQAFGRPRRQDGQTPQAV